MELEILGGYGGQSVDCRMTTVLIDGRIALDAGCLAQALPVERQRAVHTVLLTHSHIDHINSLPFFIDNVHGFEGRIEIYASAATIHAVRRHLFNNVFWPDFGRLPHHLLPTVEFHELQAEVPFEIDGLQFTPIPVTHLVPTFGFLIEDGDAAVVWSSDTGPTVRLWELANTAPRLRAVFAETSFDNAKQALADVSEHLTPDSLAGELDKLERDVPVIVHHLKPPCVAAIRDELQELVLPRVEVVRQGDTYSF